jgi:hypothetical protein
VTSSLRFAALFCLLSAGCAAEVPLPERPFHYCRFTLREGTLACDVFMLQKDDAWRRVDGFECPSPSR